MREDVILRENKPGLNKSLGLVHVVCRRRRVYKTHNLLIHRGSRKQGLVPLKQILVASRDESTLSTDKLSHAGMVCGGNM